MKKIIDEVKLIERIEEHGRRGFISWMDQNSETLGTVEIQTLITYATKKEYALGEDSPIIKKLKGAADERN